jgi:hypothetical protein
VHNHCGVHDHTYYDNVHDDDAPYGKSSKDSGSGANSSDPNISDGQYSGMDATNQANNPSNMENASKPMMVPKTSRKS